MIPRFKPTKFTDLIVAISLIRPGPIQGDMVHPYLRRRVGAEPVIYLHPLLEETLQDTLGVILFQEDVIKVARDLAGFTPGQGELLRRALGTKNAPEAIDALRSEFISGAKKKGVEAHIAHDVFEKLLAFGSYSFPKSHAAAFAVIVYQSAWLKYYHPVPFYIAILNNQPMGFWTPAIIINDAKRHNIKILTVDVNASDAKCKPEYDGIRLGLNYVKGIGEVVAQQIEELRQVSEYVDLSDLCRRTELPKRLVENLIMAGAMDRWGISRRELLWELGQLDYRSRTLDLPPTRSDVELPELTSTEAIFDEHRMLGVTTGEHIMCRYRQWLTERNIKGSGSLVNCNTGQYVWVAGLIVVHQSPPTAKGHHFITLEDEYGFLNIIIRPKAYARLWRILRESKLLAVKGEIQRQGAVINILATNALPLPQIEIS